jgi:hypothetical protein
VTSYSIVVFIGILASFLHHAAYTAIHSSLISSSLLGGNPSEKEILLLSIRDNTEIHVVAVIGFENIEFKIVIGERYQPPFREFLEICIEKLHSEVLQPSDDADFLTRIVFIAKLLEQLAGIGASAGAVSHNHVFGEIGNDLVQSADRSE